MDRRNRGEPPDTTLPKQEVSTGLRIGGIVLRSIFLCALLVLTVRVSLPQNESIWTVYDTLGDIVRVSLGFIVCVWILFPRLPKDAKASCLRRWLWRASSLSGDAPTLWLVCGQCQELPLAAVLHNSCPPHPVTAAQ
jgi:hypothetical protein